VVSVVVICNPPVSFFCHCEPTGRANARPMTGSAEAIQSQKRTGLLRRFAPRNDGNMFASL
jgi:hypothetical protein